MVEEYEYSNGKSALMEDVRSGHETVVGKKSRKQTTSETLVFL